MTNLEILIAQAAEARAALEIARQHPKFSADIAEAIYTAGNVTPGEDLRLLRDVVDQAVARLHGAAVALKSVFGVWGPDASTSAQVRADALVAPIYEELRRTFRALSLIASVCLMEGADTVDDEGDTADKRHAGAAAIANFVEIARDLRNAA